MYKILILEDHQILIEGYLTLLGKAGVIAEYTICNSIDDFFSTHKDCKKLYDLCIIDISLPGTTEEFKSGLDVALWIKTKQRSLSLLIITSHDELLKLYSWHKQLKPQGFLVKSDITPLDFCSAVIKILEGSEYFSTSINAALELLRNEELYLDDINREILLLMAKGVKTKNIPTYIDISLSAVDKRKSFIKDYLGITKGTDEDIINAARLKRLL